MGRGAGIRDIMDKSNVPAVLCTPCDTHFTCDECGRMRMRRKGGYVTSQDACDAQHLHKCM